MIAEIDVFRGVEAEAVDAEIDVILRDLEHLLPYERIIEIELRHIAREIAFVIMLRAEYLRIAPACGRAVHLAVIPGIEIVVLAVRLALLMLRTELREPFVLPAGMIDRQVDYHLYAALMAEIDERLEIVHRAEVGIDRVIIGHVVLMIGRRTENGRQPYALHSERSAGGGITVVKIIHPVDNALQIAYAVAVRIGERADEHLIENALITCGGRIITELFVLNGIFPL